MRKGKNNVKRSVPMSATNSQICKMSHDNVCVGDFSILVDAESEMVYLSEHPPGKDRKQHIEIDRRIFNKLIRWYTAGRVPTEDAKSR